MIRKQYKEAFDSLNTRKSFESDTVKLLHSVSAERNNMKSKKTVIILTAVILSVVLMAGTVYAAKLLLSSDEVATAVGELSLAEAFASPDAVIVNETIESNGYKITFMGIVSGKELSNCWNDTYANEFTDDAKSYITVAIQRTNGAPITIADELDNSVNINITPLVEGYQPWVVNRFSLSNGANGYYDNGTLYYLIAFDTLEIFADKNVSLFVYSDHLAPSSEVFSFDESTGKISYAENYSGVKAVFSVPLDSSKADPEAVKGLIESWGYTVNDSGKVIFPDE